MTTAFPVADFRPAASRTAASLTAVLSGAPSKASSEAPSAAFLLEAVPRAASRVPGLVAPAFVVPVLMAAVFPAAAPWTGASAVAGVPAVPAAEALSAWPAASVRAVVPAAVLPVTGLPSAVALPALPGVAAALVRPVPAAGAGGAFTGLAVRLADALWAFFVPFTSLAAATPPEAAAAVVLPNDGCCTAVFFATMAAAPSHIVISRANRAGTINRLLARGNGARQRFARPACAA
ncbi:hypothetical protein [Streptomyces sp. NPDC004008]